MTALADWLTRIYAIHSGPEIEMGLERIRPIFDRMAVAPKCPVILVAGTEVAVGATLSRPVQR